MLMKLKYPPEFEECYEAYPRRAAKWGSFEEYERKEKLGRLPDHDALLKAIQNFARSRIGKDMQYTEHFRKWLRHERWDDDPNALLDVKVSAPVLQCSNGKVLIKRGSPQALAWERHRGRSFPWGQSGVWAVDSEYPPMLDPHRSEAE